MTIHPDQIPFVDATAAMPKTAGLIRPNVVDHYWGYAISPNEQIVDLAVLLRGAAGLVTLASFIGAAAIWLMPAMAFVGDALVLKAMASILMTCIGAMLLRFVARGTHVRLHVDTSAGEIREVVNGLFGSDVVLARYGMDTVTAVEIVADETDASFGQVQITVSDALKVPAGDGAVAALSGLRDRLASDMVSRTDGDAPRPAEWSGPLAA